MGIPVLIYGKSGSGKSRSLKNFSEDEIFLVNVERKQLPFKKHFKYEYKTDNIEKIKEKLSKMPVKTAIIDDAGYLQTNNFMRNHSTPKYGADAFKLYNDIADSFWTLLQFIKNSLADDVIVYVMMHEEENDYGNVKLRTIGKLLEQKVCIEGMVTIALRCMCEGKKHYFRTQSDGSDISKSPEDMFELEIENDLKMVDTTIREYWDLKPNEEKENN